MNVTCATLARNRYPQKGEKDRSHESFKTIVADPRHSTRRSELPVPTGSVIVSGCPDRPIDRSSSVSTDFRGQAGPAVLFSSRSLFSTDFCNTRNRRIVGATWTTRNGRRAKRRSTSRRCPSVRFRRNSNSRNEHARSRGALLYIRWKSCVYIIYSYVTRISAYIYALTRL